MAGRGSGAAGGTAAPFERGLDAARRGELSEAETSFAQADESGHPAAASALGLIAEVRGDLEGARKAYERADERGDRLGAVRLGLLVAGGGDWDRAREIWRRAEEREHTPGGEQLEAALLGRGAAGSGEALMASAGRPPSPFTQPVLVGAVTVLVVLVCVFLAYISNLGLPFVPTRELKVDIADGTDLVAGNDVLESGVRIGIVQSMRPIVLGGVPMAQLTLQLSRTKGRLPVDSTATILSRSVLGLKYLNITVGHSSRVFADGGTMPVSQTEVPVRFDQVLGTFNQPTRKAIQQDLVGYGSALAGRGSSLNDTIAALPSLFGHLTPVARYLAAPSTELIRFFRELNAFTSTVAPVAQTNAQLFADMATTFHAISESPADLESTIQQSPGTLQVSTRSLQVQQPFLVNLTTLGRSLAPGTAELRSALPALNPAIEAGTRVLIRTPSLDRNTQQVLGALKSLAQAPSTNVAINALTGTVDVLNPMVRYLGPYVTVCNDWNYWWTNLAGDLDELTSFGYAQRALLMFGNAAQPNNVGSAGASSPANGGAPAGTQEYIHFPAYGAAVDNQGNADCETGQRGYVRMLNGLDPQHRLFDSDSHTPGNQGTTWTGQLHVPRGETFTRVPELGPAPPDVPGNP